MTTPETNEGITRASLELLYHVSREFAAALDLRTVLQRVVFLSMKTVGARSGSITVMDDAGKPVESVIIYGGEVQDGATERLRDTLDRGLAGWVMRNHQAALVTDTSQDERWMARSYAGDEETAGPKSVVSAPLLVRDSLVGVMTLSHEVPGFFTEEHLSLVQAISDQAGVSIYNARLYDESQRQARVMTALAECAAAITGLLNFEDVLLRILEQISQALRVQAVSLALIDPQRYELVFRAAIGWKSKKVDGERLPLELGLAGWSAREGRGIVLNDAKSDSRVDPEIIARTGMEVTGIACAPVRYRGQPMGVLEALNPSEGRFDSDALLVMAGIGSLAGTAIRNAQLFERLQAAHQRYRELFDDSMDPILITGWDGRILEVNRQAENVSGYQKDQLIGTAIETLHTANLEVTGEKFDKIPSSGAIAYESVMSTRGGNQVPIQVYARQVQIDDAAYLQWILRDITERKRLDTMRDDLLSMIYHDLRAPLANVVSSLNVMDSFVTEDDDPSLRSLVGIAMRSTERIERLTNSLLDIRRLEAGQPIGSRQPTNLAELARDAIEILATTIQNKHQQIENVFPDDLPPVLVDADMIRRVMINLLENASKYTPQESSIQIGGKQDGDWVICWVQDNGPGIPAEEHEHIFEKFTRLNPGHAPRGAGLGLAYCHLAVVGHGGKIWVESEPGSGARFVFKLPIQDQAGAAEETHP